MIFIQETIHFPKAELEAFEKAAIMSGLRICNSIFIDGDKATATIRGISEEFKFFNSIYSPKPELKKPKSFMEKLSELCKGRRIKT